MISLIFPLRYIFFQQMKSTNRAVRYLAINIVGASILVSCLLVAVSAAAQTQQHNNANVSSNIQIEQELLKIDKELVNINARLKTLEKMENNEQGIAASVNAPIWQTGGFYVSLILSILGILASAWISSRIAKDQVNKGSKDLETLRSNLQIEINTLEQSTKKLVDQLNKRIVDIDGATHVMQSMLEREFHNLKEIRENRLLVLGFYNIFKKAKEMLDQSQSHFWMLSFTPNFGHIHSYNAATRREIGANYTQADMYEEVIQFKTKIAAKAESQTVDFRLAYLDERFFRSEFIDPIATKIGSGLENDESAKKLITDANSQSIQYIRQSLNNKGATADTCSRAVPGIPLQIFIADSIVAEETNGQIMQKRRKACLVFFVGEGTVGSGYSGFGMYTQVDSLVKLYENIFEHIFNHGPLNSTGQTSQP